MMEYNLQKLKKERKKYFKFVFNHQTNICCMVNFYNCEITFDFQYTYFVFSGINSFTTNHCVVCKHWSDSRNMFSWNIV